MKAEQKRISFRSGVETLGKRYIETVVSETGQDKWTIMSVVPAGDFRYSPSVYVFANEFFPFQVGKEYTKAEIISYATANNYSVFETSAESLSYVPVRVDIGDTSTPTVDPGTITDTGAIVAWNNTNDAKNEGILVHIAEVGPGGEYGDWVLFDSIAPNAEQVTLTGLTPSTLYAARISPFNPFMIWEGKIVEFATIATP